MYLDFGSFLLLHRTHLICSEFHEFHEFHEQAEGYLADKSISFIFIDKRVENSLIKSLSKKQSNDSPEKKEVIFPMVFLRKVTLQIKKKLQST